MQPRPVLLCRRAHVHTGAGAAQRGGVDARLLEGLPGRLQQQPLLGLHRRRLAGTDAEELGIKPVRIVQETTLGGVGLAGAVRIGGEERIKVPAPVGRESADRIDLAADQTPQVLRRGDPSRQPTCHAHDRDRLVKGYGLVRIVILALVQAEELTTEVFGEYDRGRVVEKEAGGQREPGGPVQRVPKLDGREGVEAQVLEGRVDVHIARRSVAEHCCHVRTHQLQLIAARRGPLRTAPPCRNGPDLDRPGRRTLQPERLTLEGIRGQIHQTRTRQEALPLHPHTACVRLCDRGQETIPSTVVAPQRSDNNSAADAGPVGRVTEGRGQHRVGTDLDEDAMPVVKQSTGGLFQLDGPAQVAEPVPAVELLTVQRLPGDGGEEPDVTGTRRDVGQQLPKLILQHVDVGGVRGVVGRNGAGTVSLDLTLCDEVGQGLRVAGDDRAHGAVVCGDIDRAAPMGDELANLVGR